MIVWSRWGILVLLMVGLGVGTGALLGAAVAGTTQGPTFSLFMGVGLVFAGLYTWLLNHFVVEPHLDKPRQHFLLQPLPQPVRHPNGVTQTHQQVPVLHPETGQPVYVRPRSTFFFAPVRYWPFVLAGIGLLVTIVNAIGLLTG